MLRLGSNNRSKSGKVDETSREPESGQDDKKVKTPRRRRVPLNGQASIRGKETEGESQEIESPATNSPGRFSGRKAQEFQHADVEGPETTPLKQRSRGAITATKVRRALSARGNGKHLIPNSLPMRKSEGMVVPAEDKDEYRLDIAEPDSSNDAEVFSGQSPSGRASQFLQNQQPKSRRRRAWSLRMKDGVKTEGDLPSPVAEAEQKSKEVNIPRAKGFENGNETLLAEQKAALASLHHPHNHETDAEALQRRFTDRDRPMNRRGSFRGLNGAIEGAPPPAISVVQGFTDDAEVTYLGDGAGYLSEEEDAGRWRKSSRQILGLLANRKPKAPENPEKPPAELLAIDVFDTCRCLRIIDGNSMLVEAIPRHLSAEVYNAHNAYTMARQQNLVASTRKYLADLHRLGYYPMQNGSVARVVRVRLRGVTAPRRGQRFHEEAVQFLSEKLAGRKVHVYVYWKDQYERAVGDVIVLDDRTMVSISVLKAGLAWYSAEYDRGSDLISVEKDARREKVGIWSLRNPVPPW